ncbi:hypothetical protein [Methylobacterium nigriterrae]|uniref:hypothetical protein n=1 Tax=Methylobacterium nigriterrae TaxID=3127512 RepID=UPI0030139716
MNAALIAMNNEVVCAGSARLLSPLRAEGLLYRLWVTGSARGSTVHLRITGLTHDMRLRVISVLQRRGIAVDVADALSG